MSDWTKRLEGALDVLCVGFANYSDLSRPEALEILVKTLRKTADDWEDVARDEGHIDEQASA